MNKLKLILFLFLISCKTNVEKTEIHELVYQDCFSKEERSGAISSILKHKKFQFFLHPEVRGRLPVRLLKSEFISADMDMTINGKRVILESNLDEESSTVSIRIDSLDCDLKKFNFYLYYPIEGAVIIGTSQLIDEKWIIKIITSGEM